MAKAKDAYKGSWRASGGNSLSYTIPGLKGTYGSVSLTNNSWRVYCIPFGGGTPVKSSKANSLQEAKTGVEATCDKFQQFEIESQAKAKDAVRPVPMGRDDAITEHQDEEARVNVRVQPVAVKDGPYSKAKDSAQKDPEKAYGMAIRERAKIYNAYESGRMSNAEYDRKMPEADAKVKALERAGAKFDPLKTYDSALRVRPV